MAKKHGKKPTSIRALKAIDNLVANGGNKAKAIKDAGFSEKTARTPSKVFGSLSVKELIEAKLPNEELFDVHREGLYATKIHGSMTEPDRVVVDFQTRHKYLETGYKLKGLLKEGQTPPGVQFNFTSVKNNYK